MFEIAGPMEKANLGAAGPMRRAALDKDMDESRQPDELLNYQDSTVRRESPARENESAIRHPGTGLSGQCSKTVHGRREHIPSKGVINGLVSESQYGRVVFLSMRKLLEKLKSFVL